MTSCFPFTLSFGFKKTVHHCLVHGSFITSNSTALLTLLASQSEQVALLHLLRLVLQWSSFRVLAIGRQMPLNDTYEKM
jgi:hypothetical protein